jgi:hypothetical protein
MNKQMLKLMILALALVVLGHTAEARAQANLLQNASFEMPYGSNGEADKWGRWHHNSGPDQFGDCTNGYHKLPHWSPETNPALVRNGSASQHIGNNWDTWKAGVFQTVPATPGTTYRFSVWAYSFASNEDFPNPSDGSLQSNMRVGIDPNGSGLWNDADVVWSGAINPLDNWQQISLEVTATGNQITVFTSADWGVPGVNQCRLHIDSWFDQAELIAIGPPPTNTPLPQPTRPPVTNTPIPPTATATVPATATAVPTSDLQSPTPIPTDTPPPGGTICINAFADENGNGEHEENEGFMGGVTFTVATATQLTGQAVSTGTSEAVCFEGLPPGQYTITQLIPGSLQMTTAASTVVDLTEAQEIGVEFGSRIQTTSPTQAATEVAELPGSDTGTDGSTGTDTPTDSSDSESDSSSPLAFGGLILLIIAIIMLGVLIFLVLRGQRAGNQ